MTVTSVSIRRVRANVVEYTVVHELYGEVSVRTYHANRYATFHGVHTGAPARQIRGGARTIWRESDADLIRAARRMYRCADVAID